jgi:hypothetical protein
MASGIYGIRLRYDDTEDIIPIYVRPRAGTATAPIVFLASTFTYQVYGNHRRGSVNEAFRARQAEWNAYPWNADEYPEFGASTYNKHPDAPPPFRCGQKRYPAGTSNSMNVRLTEAEINAVSMACRTTEVSHR